jgi:parallel beta-helix repeat protein
VKFTAVLLSMLLIGTFGLVIWNMYLPIQSAKNEDFLNYVQYSAKNAYNDNQLVKDVLSPIVGRQQVTGTSNASLDLGPRTLLDENGSSTVTLTFYVRYGNQQDLIQLLDLLQEHKVGKAVFFVEERYLNDHYFVAKRISDQGYIVKTWSDLSAYNAPGYSPTVYRGITLTENEILSQGGTDSDTMQFVRAALHHFDSSIIAFSPQIMEHRIVLENLLEENGNGIVFSDQPASALNESPISPLMLISEGNNEATRINGGNWTMGQLAQLFPSTVHYDKQESAYIVIKPLIFGKGSTLQINRERILLLSSSISNAQPTYIEIFGHGAIVNSNITSWDSTRSQPEIDPFIPRPYLVVKGGQLDVLNSTISHLGYSIGGLKDTTYAHAALEYYNASGFVISNSTLSFNYYGFYSEASNNFRIVNNEVYGQTSYGIHPNTHTVDFIIESNRVHDNGNLGILCSQCANAKISNNIVEYNDQGIGLHKQSSSNQIQGNVVRYNEKYGILVQDKSYNNAVEKNTIVGNNFGIGILEGSSHNTVANNILTENVLDTLQVDANSPENELQNNQSTAS